MSRKRRKILKLARGDWGSKHMLFKTANLQVMKSLQFAYVGRKLKKRDFASCGFPHKRPASHRITIPPDVRSKKAG
jgi:ribosomal protein L20